MNIWYTYILKNSRIITNIIHNISHVRSQSCSTDVSKDRNNKLCPARVEKKGRNSEPKKNLITLNPTYSELSHFWLAYLTVKSSCSWYILQHNIYIVPTQYNVLLYIYIDTATNNERFANHTISNISYNIVMIVFNPIYKRWFNDVHVFCSGICTWSHMRRGGEIRK